MNGEIETLRWEFDLVWRLAACHVPRLTDESCLWSPAPGALTVRRGADGTWRADWPEDLDAALPTTIGWLSWHWLWWWSSALATLDGAPVPPRDGFFWPGSAGATRAALDDLAARWRGRLDALHTDDLDRAAAYPWPQAKPLRLMLAWAHLETMKAVAEIGTLRAQFAATR